MTKFNVGDKVRVNSVASMCMNGFNVGDICVITNDDGSDKYRYTIRCDSARGYAKSENLTLFADSNVRLTEAEAKIATLEAEVKALKDASKPKTFVVQPCFAKVSEDADIKRIASEMMSRLRPAKQTPNQRRADVIKRAQAFVADLEKRASEEDAVNSDGNELFNVRITQLEFHDNAEKRVVTALAKYYNGEVAEKAFAKCAPGDVFNADIGKAIAAGRLYGLDVSEFENAVKPTEYAVGQSITFPEADDWYLKVNYRVDSYDKGFGDLTVIYDEFDNDVGRKGYLMPAGRTLAIIDDSEAVYE